MSNDALSEICCANPISYDVVRSGFRPYPVVLVTKNPPFRMLDVDAIPRYDVLKLGNWMNLPY